MATKSARPRRKGAAGGIQSAPRRTLISAVHPTPTIKINHGATFLVTDQHGNIPLAAGDCGLYSDDTRFVSRHEIRINGRRPESVASVRLSFRHARWHLIADDITNAQGDMRGARVAVTVDRLIGLHEMHEDLTLRSYGRAALSLLLEIAIESDFADLFEVRWHQWWRRPELQTLWSPPNSLEAHYRNADFVRRCVVRTLTDRAGITYANGSLRFPVDLQPGEEWRLCLQYDLLTSEEAQPILALACPFDEEGEEEGERQSLTWQRSVSQIEPADIRLKFAYAQQDSRGSWPCSAGIR